MINLDLRDLNTWVQEAQKRHLENQLNLIDGVRAGMSADSDYQRIVKELKNKINQTGVRKDEIIKQTWSDLIFLGR